MDFELTDRCKDFRERLLAFMDERIYPAESTWHEQLVAGGKACGNLLPAFGAEPFPPAESAGHEQPVGGGDPPADPPVMEELKEDARSRGLWNMFHPDTNYGPGLKNVEYAPLAEIMGRS